MTGLRHDLRLACTSENYRSVLKQVLKRCDNRKSCRRPVVSLSHAIKIVPCKSALTIFSNLIALTTLFLTNYCVRVKSDSEIGQLAVIGYLKSNIYISQSLSALSLITNRRIYHNNHSNNHLPYQTGDFPKWTNL